MKNRSFDELHMPDAYHTLVLLVLLCQERLLLRTQEAPAAGMSM